MSKSNLIPIKEITQNGLWRNNAALVQLLGLCPLLAVSNSVVNAVGLGLATICVLVMSNTIVSLARHRVTRENRLAVFVMIIAAATTCVELLMQAFTFELYQTLGIFIPLIVTNCTVLGRADGFAAKNNVVTSALDGLMTGIGFLLVLVTLGAFREIIGQGSLFAQMNLLIQFWPQNWIINMPDNFQSVLLMILPPGAFIGLGLLIAFKNYFETQLLNPRQKSLSEITPGSKRVRVTGSIK